MRCPLSAIALFMLLFTGPAAAQDRDPEHQAETMARVAALDDFHKVIYQLWHTAWPKKDYGMLVKLLPDLQKGTAEIVKAKLPGILREKEDAWKANVKKLQDAVGAYDTSIQTSDTAKALAAAEQLHSQYEALVRTIRPAMKEVEEFHAELYMLYHYYMPEYKIEKIKTASAALEVKMGALNVAKLPDRMKSKTDAFNTVREKLTASVRSLQESIATNDKSRINAAINAVHSDYEALDRVFK